MVPERNPGPYATLVNPVREKKDILLMESICEVANNSPLCGKWELYYDLKKITDDRLPPKEYGRAWEIMLGISYAESHLGQDFAKDSVGGECRGRNNFGGAKYLIRDDNTREFRRLVNGFDYEYSKSKRKQSDQFGCNLFPFASYQEAWQSKVNGMRYGYKSCFTKSNTPIACISNTYLTGNKSNWIRNVASFMVDDSVVLGQP